MAITGFVIAVVALVLCFVPIINNFAFFLALVGLVFGIIGLVKTRKGAPRKGIAIASIIVAVIAGIGVVASQAFYSNALDSVSADLDKISGDATEQVLADDVTVEIGDFTADEDEYGLATTALPVTLTNTSDETQSYDVTVEAVDESGQRIAEDVAYVSDLRAGQSQQVDVFQFVEEGDLDAMRDATFEVVEASVY
ncbi:FxLYD domain-containing protein [Isoptericola sp. NPDC019693]|uniref:FxLYD domain-containing protein n=1 Tax=Isoptericola sp. NPDC019693 TaxID=3364009 RepID=UPI0037BC3EEE